MTEKRCKKCGESKPLADFKRQLSRSQAKAQGYKGDFLVTVESPNCKACRPRQRKLTELSAKELQNKVASGDISELDRKLILEKRDAINAVKRREGTTNRWIKQWNAELSALLKPLQDEILSVERQCRYARVGKREEQVTFFEWYAQTLRQQKAKIELDYTRNPRRVTTSRWEEMLDKELASEVREGWADIELEDRMRLKQPALVLFRGK